MYNKVSSTSHYNNHSGKKSIICPHCNHNVALEVISQDTKINEAYVVGSRKCPRPECYGHIFVILDSRSPSFIKAYPPVVINFDKANVPAKVLIAFSEALICHSNECYIASAIMVRKTLEEICKDRAAVGSNLYQKLQDLSSKILIPIELKEAMNELRLLGNDAAHIEAHTFEEVGKEEIEISIEFTKEILKALYQYEGLLDKLRGLKKGS